MLPLLSTTRHVGAGVSGTLKLLETFNMLLPFSIEWLTVPVLAFGPWNCDDVCISILAANALTVTSSASTAKTDHTFLSCFISILLVKVLLGLPFHDLNGMTIRVAERDCFPESRLAVRQLYSPG